MIGTATREAIKTAVDGLFKGVLSRFDPGNPENVLDDPARLQRDGRLLPFHQALLTPVFNYMSSFERSFSTTLGTMFEVTAELIGQERFEESCRRYDVTGHISTAAQAGIDGIVDQIRSEGFNGEYRNYVNAVVNTFHADQISLTVRADLYLRTYEGTEFFFAMSS